MQTEASPCCGQLRFRKTFAGRPATRQTSAGHAARSEEHTSELQSQSNLVCRLLLEKKKKNACNHFLWYRAGSAQRLSRDNAGPVISCSDDRYVEALPRHRAMHPVVCLYVQVPSKHK